MATATYVFEVRWDGVAWTDETAYCLRLEYSRGRDRASQLTGKALPGSLTATLRNTDGRFSPFNTASPLTGNILPGRAVRLRATAPSAVTLWSGFLDEMQPEPGLGWSGIATLSASGPLKWFATRKAATAVYASIATGTAVGYVLDDAGWPAGDRTIDTGQVTVTRWQADGDRAIFHLRELEETEFGYLGESADGKVVFEDVHHRLLTPHTVSQATFSDAPGATLSYRPLRELDPWGEIFNDFQASVVLFSVQALGVLWTHPETGASSPSIAAGASKTYWASYPNPDSVTQAHSVDAWTTPAATTDFTANSASDGSGSDLTASIAVVVSKFANSMKITITNNHASSTAYITFLQARGTAVYRSDPARVSSEDSASQTSYGKRSYPLPGKFYPSTAVAQSYTDYGLSRHKDKLAVLSMPVIGSRDSSHLTQVLTRDISDRITVVANNGQSLGINADFFIERMAHIIEPGRYHVATYDLSDATGDGGYWALGTSTLGQSTRLAV